MKTVLIACSMLRDELEKSLKDKNASLDIVWMEKALHEKPEILRRALQEEIDNQQDREAIILAYGLCGNAVLGLRSEKTALVIPKYDDCIHLLRSTGPCGRPEVDSRCLYFTRGWIESDRFILRQFRDYRIKYGEQKAARIVRRLLGNYRGIRLIDTGAYDTALYADRLRDDAAYLGLGLGVVPGTRRVLDKLASGNFDSEFCVIPPGREVALEDFEGRIL